MDLAATVNKSDRLKKLEKKVADNPDSAMNHAKLGTALLSTGATKRAEAEFNTALELDPQCVPAMINLGGIYLNRWDFPKCIEINQKAAEFQPEIVEAHYNQGLGYLYQSQPKEMVDCFKRVIELDENHPGGHYHLAVGLLALGDTEAAKLELSKAMNLGFKPEPQLLKALGKEDKKKSPHNKNTVTKH